MKKNKKERNKISFFSTSKKIELIIYITLVCASTILIILPIFHGMSPDEKTICISIGISILSASVLSLVLLVNEMCAMHKRRIELLSRITEKAFKFFYFLLNYNNKFQEEPSNLSILECFNKIKSKKCKELSLNNVTNLLKAHLYSDLTKCEEKSIRTFEWKGVNSCKVYLEMNIGNSNYISMKDLKFISDALQLIPMVNKAFNKNISCCLSEYNIEDIEKRKTINFNDDKFFMKTMICYCIENDTPINTKGRPLNNAAIRRKVANKNIDKHLNIERHNFDPRNND